MQLHPSVIMSISEHHSRTKAIRQEPFFVIGALLGRKSDLSVEIVDSFELKFTQPLPDENNFILDKEFYGKKIDLVTQVSGDLIPIGWYSTTSILDSDTIQGWDISLHKQVSEFIPNPIYLKLNPYRREIDPKISGSLPLKIYEPVIEFDADKEHLCLIEIGWTIVTEDVEIIGLEHNAKVSHVDLTPSPAIDYLRLQYSAVKMLKDRIKVISKFVKDVQSGALPYHGEPMRDIAKLSQRFPIMNSDQYTQAYNMQCNDVALNTYLGILTKGSMCKLNFGKQGSKTRALSSTHVRR